MKEFAMPIYGLAPHVLFYTQLIFGLGAAASVFYCVTHALKTRSLFAIYILIGGGLCSLYEAYADTGGLAIYPQIGVPMLIDELGRRIPVFVLLIYLFFFPAPFILLIEQLNKGLRYQYWVATCVFSFISSVVFEFIPIHYKVWVYYGHYPFVILGHPIVWGIMNGQSVMSGAAILYLLLKQLKPSQHFLLMAAVPIIFFGVHFAVAMPTYTVLNSTSDQAIIDFGVMLSMVMGMALPILLGRLVCISPITANNPARKT